jgi:NTP pyrophosphohydrolases including oxidative damage repair enzymes
MTEVKFYDPGFVPAGHLTYSVITARFKDQWIFVRHNDRSTWEIPGGHIEESESSDEAASRELMEETGATNFSLDCVATYSVEKNGSTGFGRLYFAEVVGLGIIPDSSEIAEAMPSYDIPGNLTWPDIQPHLFRKVIDYLEKKGKI